MVDLDDNYYYPANMKCEIWRAIKEFPKYTLSNLGRVKRIDKGNILEPDIKISKNGTVTYYFKLCEGSKRFTFNLKDLMVRAKFEPDASPPLRKEFKLIYNKSDEFLYKMF